MNFSTDIVGPSTPPPDFLDKLTEGCIVTNGTFLECENSKAFKHWLRTAQLQTIIQVENVTVENWYGKILHPLMLTGMKNLKEFVITSGNLTGFAGDFPPLKNLQVRFIILRCRQYLLIVLEQQESSYNEQQIRRGPFNAFQKLASTHNG